VREQIRDAISVEIVGVGTVAVGEGGGAGPEGQRRRIHVRHVEAIRAEYGDGDDASARRVE
jgi:hypothetical protein